MAAEQLASIRVAMRGLHVALVAAVCCGSEVPAVPVQTQTQCRGAPPSAPQNLVAKAGIRTATLMWRPPLASDCPITTYEVEIATNGTTRTESTTELHMELTGFIDGGGAAFSVRALSGTARSEPAKAEVWFPAPPPGPDNRFAFPRKGGIVVTWTPPALAEFIANPQKAAYPIDAYIIDTPDGRRLTVDPSIRSIALDLPAGGPYAASISARNAVGTCLPRQTNPVSALPSAWRFAGMLPEPRSQHTMVAVNAFLYLLGGSDGSWAPLAPTRSFGLGTDGAIASTAVQTLAPPRRRSSTALFASDPAKAYVVVTGGLEDRVSTDVVAAAQLHDGQVSPWAEGTPLPTPRSYHSSAVVGRFLFIAGGFAGSDVSADVLSAPLASNGLPAGCGTGCSPWQTQPPLPSPRIWAAMASWTDYLYVIGGYDRRGDRADVLVSKVAADGQLERTWMTTLPLPTPLSGMVAAVAGNHLYVVGGANTSRVFLGTLSPKTGEVLRWRELAPFIGDRNFATAAIVGQRVLLCGGQGLTGMGLSDCQTAAFDSTTGELISTEMP